MQDRWRSSDGKSDTILELLIRLFCARLTEAVRNRSCRAGMWITQTTSLPCAAASTSPDKFSRHAVAPQKLACRYDDLSSDIALNQVMRTAVTRLQRVAQAPDNQRILRELGFAYADVTEVPVPALAMGTKSYWIGPISGGASFFPSRGSCLGIGISRPVPGELQMVHRALVRDGMPCSSNTSPDLVTRASGGKRLNRVAAQGGHRDCLFEAGTGRCFGPNRTSSSGRGIEPSSSSTPKWETDGGPRIDDPKQGVSQADGVSIDGL